MTTYTYDYRNRLTDVVETSAGGIVLSDTHYTYDVFDHRISVTVNGQTYYTVYNGDNPWADYSSVDQIETRYLFGNQTNEIWGLLASRRGDSLVSRRSFRERTRPG